jgi:hypothetical protein
LIKEELLWGNTSFIKQLAFYILFLLRSQKSFLKNEKPLIGSDISRHLAIPGGFDGCYCRSFIGRRELYKIWPDTKKYKKILTWEGKGGTVFPGLWGGCPIPWVPQYFWRCVLW